MLFSDKIYPVGTGDGNLCSTLKSFICSIEILNKTLEKANWTEDLGDAFLGFSLVSVYRFLRDDAGCDDKLHIFIAAVSDVLCTLKKIVRPCQLMICIPTNY